ncbi:MAG: hypothetical protein ACREIB_11480 [Pseudomonadota bacterium]
MDEYLVISPLDHDGKRYAIGHSVKLSAEQAEPLLGHTVARAAEQAEQAEPRLPGTKKAPAK